MDASFIPVETVPSKTPFGLDQLRRSYKTSLSAEDAIAACPAIGTADETFAFMFLMPVNTPESAESATRVDLVYQGCLAGDGSPTLPAQKHSSGDSVASATSSINVVCQTGPPITIQFYQPQNVLSYFSFEAAGTDEADNPTADIRIISFTLGDQALAVDDFATWIPNFFSVFYQTTINSDEIVPGKYWQNTATTIKTYLPIVCTPP